MRKTLLTLLLVLPLAAAAQDSAAAIVARYLRMLNPAALAPDSMLVLHTTITHNGSTDTFDMVRWYAAPGMMRVEVHQGDSLMTGLCTNGTTRFREYSTHLRWWNDLDSNSFANKMQAYDHRSPFYDHLRRGISLYYDGVTSFNGQKLQVVRTEQKNHYVRQYLFEEQSGLLVVVLEKKELPAGSVEPVIKLKPIDYKVIHEYMPYGAGLVPSEESYMRDGLLTIMRTTVSVEPRDNMIFNQD